MHNNYLKCWTDKYRNKDSFKSARALARRDLTFPI
jgi:hypothetical protein